MIFGIGVDVLEAARIKKVLARFGDHFVDRLLMPAERAQLGRTKRPERFLAMRFAAKEAIVKAMGTGFAHGIWIRDVGVVQNAWGKPEVAYSPRGEKVRRKLGIGDGHVTLTDEAGLIVAVAVLEAAPKPQSAKREARQAQSQRRSAGEGAPMNTLVFDIETVPDVEFGRRLFGLEGLSDDEVGKAMQAKARQDSGSDFLPHEQHRIVAISCAFRSREGFRVWSLGDEGASERELVERFFDGIDKFTPELVSWNGGGFDLPVLHYRALRFKVQAPRYWETGDEDNAFRYNNYLGRFHWRHIDVMDVLSGYQASRPRLAVRYGGAAGISRQARLRRFAGVGCVSQRASSRASATTARRTSSTPGSSSCASSTCAAGSRTPAWPMNWRARAPGSPMRNNRTSTSSSPPGRPRREQGGT